MKYVDLDQVLLWERNPKLHDIPSLIAAFEKHGFKDPPRFEPELNGGKGGLGHGGGRAEAVRLMRDNDMDPPRGIGLDGDGNWFIPMIFGVDAESEKAAEAYAVDHNNLTLAGGSFDEYDYARLWSEDYLLVLQDLGDLPVTVGSDFLDVVSIPEPPKAKPKKKQEEGVDFVFGEIRVRVSFDLYVRFAEEVMVSGGVNEVLSAWLLGG